MVIIGYYYWKTKVRCFYMPADIIILLPKVMVKLSVVAYSCNLSIWET